MKNRKFSWSGLAILFACVLFPFLLGYVPALTWIGSEPPALMFLGQWWQGFFFSLIVAITLIALIFIVALLYVIFNLIFPKEKGDGLGT